MAEINTSDSGSANKARSKKQSTKIDMTPMVDLGFLLITFFMLTTTLSKPVTMQLNMPDEGGDVTSPIPCSKSLNVVLGEDNKIYYYEGLACNPQLKVSNFKEDGIRNVLFNYKRRVGDMFTVIIKSTDAAKYHNVVDLIDELIITNNSRYAIVALTDEDKQLIASRKF
jgi:biopolymer transport protein ExbD